MGYRILGYWNYVTHDQYIKSYYTRVIEDLTVCDFGTLWAAS